MKIQDVLREKGGRVITIEPERTVHEAIGVLNEHGIGALVVTGADQAIRGILTERDILHECGNRCVALEQPPASEGKGCPALVKDVMTAEVLIGVPDDDLNYVMGVMTKNRIRHLPVLEGGKLVGIISIGDVVNAHLQEKEYENRMLKDYIHGVIR
jgi:CBS domain-containing protein